MQAPSQALYQSPLCLRKRWLITAEVDWNKDPIHKFLNDIELDDIIRY